MIEQVLAGLGLAVCVGLLVRHGLSVQRRERLDDRARRAAQTVKQAALRLWHWRSIRQNARRAAEEAIQRAQGSVTRDGNVYRPKSFREPRKPH
jgi:hypothetical protein